MSMEYLTCKSCGKEKPVSSFYKQKGARTGYSIRCKICQLVYNREHRFKPPKYKSSSLLKLTNVKKKDYCLMFEYLGRKGYDLGKSIHLQFCEKYNLTPQFSRNKKDLSRYGPDDCV